MQTDGVSLCVMWQKNGMKTQAHGRKRKRGESASQRRARTYHDIAELSADELQAKGQCVLIDPNRRDILFAMRESSTPENPLVYRYTSMSRRRHSGTKAARRRRAREVGNDPQVQAALVTLSATTFMSMSRGTYEAYLLARSAVIPMLDEFYGQEIFQKLRFRCFYARNNTQTVLSTTYALNLGILSSYLEIQQLRIANFTHLRHVSGFGTFCNTKVLTFSY